MDKVLLYTGICLMAAFVVIVIAYKLEKYMPDDL